MSGSHCGIERRVAVQLVDGIAAGSSRAAELMRCCASLSASPHPNIVRIYDLVQEGRVFCVVMEFLEGLSLRAILDDAAPDALSQQEVLPIVTAIGEALQYLHTKQMVHGRLQPTGVFMTLDRKVKLLDVPLARPPASAPYYVEDEHESDDALPSDDVYGLACLTYELLCGSHPFNANSPLDAHRAGLVPAPIAGLRREQWAALEGALALSREARTPGIAEFLRALARGAAQGRDATAEHDRPERGSDDREPVATTSGSAAASGVRGPIEIVAGPPRHRAPATGSGSSAGPDASAIPPRRARRRVAVATLAVVMLAAAAAGYTVGFGGLDDLKSVLEAWPASISAPSPERRDRARESVSVDEAPESGAVSGVARLPEAPKPTVVPDPVSASLVSVEPVSRPAAPEAATDRRLPVPNLRDARASNPPAAEASTGQPSMPAAVAPASSEPPFSFTRHIVQVSESQSAVALTIVRAADAPATVIWWCRGETATADEDFADLGQRTETFGPDETRRTIFVPIVMDSEAEPTESFSVYLGASDGERRELRVLSTVRVEIADDD